MTHLRPALGSSLGAAACLLASTSLIPLFDGVAWWFVPVTAVVPAIFAAGAVGRWLAARTGLPRTPIGLAATLITLLIVLTAWAARDTAPLGVIPTPATIIALKDLVLDGRSDIAHLSPPVPERPGLTVLVMLGVALVAVVVDLLVAVVERPPLAGLPLLALFVVPAAVLPGGVGSLPFVLGAVGFIALLLLDGHLMVTCWGHTVTQRRPRSIHASLGSLGGRVAVGALVLAAVTPLVVPSLDGRGVVDNGGGGGPGDGPSSASVVQPIVSLSQQLHADEEIPLLTVRADAPRYLRLTALENFDGQRFTLRALNADRDDRVSEGLPGPETDVRTTTTSATISISPELDERYLPVPGIPTGFEGLQGDWRLAQPTGTIFSTRTSTSGIAYGVTAEVPAPTRAELAAATGEVPDGMDDVTAFPADLDPRLAALLDEIVRDAATPYDRVFAIQEFLRGPEFTYDLQGAPTIQDGALAEFLFTTRRGYCEQFASAMTVLVRMLGLPARVAIGFSFGERQADGTFLVTNKRAHAWPEVWFPSVGWLSFEPTRRDDGATTTPPYAPSATEDEAASAPETLQGAENEGIAVPTPSAVPQGAEQDPAQADLEGTDPDGAGAAGSAFRFRLIWLLWAAVAVALLALLSLPALVRFTLRRSRMTPGAANPTEAAAVAIVHAAWAELIDIAADLGIRLRSSDSPRSGAGRLVAYLEAGPEADTPQVAQARDALLRLAAAEERARYAPPGMMAAPDPDGRTMRDLAIARRTLWAVAPRSRRAVAAVAPPSVLRRATDLPMRDILGRIRRTKENHPGEQSIGDDNKMMMVRRDAEDRAGVG